MAGVLELEEQAVAVCGGERRRERHGRAPGRLLAVLGGVGVGVGEVALAQCDEVAAGPEVGSVCTGLPLRETVNSNSLSASARERPALNSTL